MSFQNNEENNGRSPEQEQILSDGDLAASGIHPVAAYVRKGRTGNAKRVAKSREMKAKDEGIYQVNVRVNEDAEKHIRAIAKACQEGHRWPLPPWAEDDIVTRIG